MTFATLLLSAALVPFGQAKEARRPGPEYVPIPLVGDPERFFRDLLGDAGKGAPPFLRDLVEKELRRMMELPPDKQRELLHGGLGEKADNPLLKQLIDQFLDQPAGKVGDGRDPAEAFKEFGKKLLQDEPFGEPLLKDLAAKLKFPDGDPNAKLDAPKLDLPKLDGSIPPKGDPFTAKDVPVPPGLTEPTLEQKFAEQMLEWFRDGEGGGALADLLRDSPGVKGAMEDLAKTLEGGWGGWTPKLPDWVPPGGFDLSLPKLPGLGNLPKFDPPSLPSLPKVSLPLPNLGGFSVPSLPSLGGGGGGPPSLPSAGDGSTWLNIALAFAIVAGLAYLARRWGVTLTGKPVLANAYRLPDAVRTREELCRAFDALALARWGVEVESRHHWEAVRRFAVDDATRGAADGLGEVYERARYAPGDGLLAPDDQTRALECLRSLAAASAAPATP